MRKLVILAAGVVLAVAARGGTPGLPTQNDIPSTSPEFAAGIGVHETRTESPDVLQFPNASETTTRIEAFSSARPWPIWAKVWIGFWLGMTLFCAVLACQQWWEKRKAIKSQQSWHLHFSRLAGGGNVDPQNPIIFENFGSRNPDSTVRLIT